MDKNKKKTIWIAALVGVITTSITATAFAVSNIGKVRLSYDEQKLIDGYRLIKDEWLFGDEQDYFGSYAMKGMISSFSDEKGDPFTFYTDDMDEQGLSTDSSGFGVTMRYYNGGFLISEIHPNSPASNKFFENTTKLLAINDVFYGVQIGSEPYYDFTLHTQQVCLEYIRKDRGDVRYLFTVKRGKDEVYQLSLVKGIFSQRLLRVVKTPTPENDETLMIKLNTFLGDPYSALVGTLNAYKDKNVRHLVIDLRQNGGGYVNQAEEIAKLFVKKGTLIDKMVNKDGKVISECYQKKNPMFQFPDYSLIIDDHTASAAETFALAMRAGTNAKIYGLQSYGKGIAQAFKTFDDGSVVRYTYAYVYGPERANENIPGENEDSDDIVCIHKKGIVPDVKFSKEYTYLNTIYDYTESLGISEYGQRTFLKALNDIHPDVYPTDYAKDFHFVDAVKEYGKNSAVLYDDVRYEEAFDKKGYFSKTLNDLFIKECYDTYLKYEEALTQEVIGALL